MSAKLASRLVEPDYWTCPHGKAKRPEPYLTYGPEVADLCARADFAPDPQQELGLDLIFAIRPDGSPASFAGCVICCRQNLKTGLFKQAALGWMYVTEEPTMVWSSHEMTTTTDAQRDLENLITSKPFLSKHLAPGITNGIFYGSLGQRIEFASGQQVMFKARTNTGGRGLARRKLILDEAFALTPAMMGSFMPVLMAQVNAQVLYGSSAGKADSDVLLDVRDRGRNGKSPRLFYLEWLAPHEDCGTKDCAHPKDAAERGLDCALDRESLLRKANPAITTGRITLERLRDLRQEMPPEEYARECLGWWDEPTNLNLFGVGAWKSCAGPQEPGLEVRALSLAVSMDQSTATVSAVGVGEKVVVKPLQHGPGVWWTAQRLKELQARHRVPVIVDGRGPAASLVRDLEAAKVRLHVCTTAEVLDAWDTLFKLVSDGGLSHDDYPELNAAVNSAATRSVGDRTALARRTATANISALESVMLATWWATRPKPATQPQRLPHQVTKAKATNPLLTRGF